MRRTCGKPVLSLALCPGEKPRVKTHNALYNAMALLSRHGGGSARQVGLQGSQRIRLPETLEIRLQTDLVCLQRKAPSFATRG